MAQTRDIRLEMGWQTDQLAYAEVRFSVEFSEAELRRNMNYGLYVGLFYHDERMYHAEMEQNGAYQTLLMPTYPYGMDAGAYGGNMPGQPWQNGNGSNEAAAHSDGWQQRASGLVSWICREQLQPGTTQTHHINRRTTFDLGRMPRQQAEYRALVWAVPEISTGQGWSRPQRGHQPGFVQGFQPMAFAY